jgi:hypothetical protein
MTAANLLRSPVLSASKAASASLVTICGESSARNCSQQWHTFGLAERAPKIGPPQQRQIVGFIKWCPLLLNLRRKTILTAKHTRRVMWLVVRVARPEDA